VFDECPYDEGYDLKIGESHNGDFVDFVDFERHRGFNHALVFFGGLEGIEGIVEELDENTNLKVADIKNLFDEYVNTCPERGCRITSLRTEESVLISLGALMPRLRGTGQSIKTGYKKSKKESSSKKSEIKSTLL